MIPNRFPELLVFKNNDTESYRLQVAWDEGEAQKEVKAARSDGFVFCCSFRVSDLMEVLEFSNSPQVSDALKVLVTQGVLPTAPTEAPTSIRKAEKGVRRGKVG